MTEQKQSYLPNANEDSDSKEQHWMYPSTDWGQHSEDGHRQHRPEYYPAGTIALR